MHHGLPLCLEQFRQDGDVHQGRSLVETVEHRELELERSCVHEVDDWDDDVRLQVGRHYEDVVFGHVAGLLQDVEVIGAGVHYEAVHLNHKNLV